MLASKRIVSEVKIGIHRRLELVGLITVGKRAGPQQLPCAD